MKQTHRIDHYNSKDETIVTTYYYALPTQNELNQKELWDKGGIKRLVII